MDSDILTGVTIGALSQYIWPEGFDLWTDMNDLAEILTLSFITTTVVSFDTN